MKEPCAESWANQPQVAVLDGGATLDPAWPLEEPIRLLPSCRLPRRVNEEWKVRPMFWSMAELIR